MNSIVDVKAFASALSKVLHYTEKAPVLSLEEVKADFRGDCCVLSATNLEQWASVEIPAQGEEFSFLFRQTREVVKLCKGLTGEISFDFQPDEKSPKLCLTCGSRSGSFSVYPGGDFPTPPELEESKTYAIDATELRQRVERVSYAADVKSDRPAVGGVRFLRDQVYCVDGYRMAVSDSKSLTVEKPFVVPVQAFRHWEALFPAGAAELAVGEKLVRITMPGVTLLSRLLTPDLLEPHNVFPTSCPDSCMVDPKAYRRELAYLSEFVKDKNRQPIRFRAGQLSVETSNGTFSTQVELEGNALTEYGFHVRYMMEALRSFEGYERIRMENGGPKSPIVLRADEENYAMILPVKLGANRAAA